MCSCQFIILVHEFYFVRVPNSKDSVIFWIQLSDEKKKKLIQDVYMAEELNQELKRNGKCTRASLVIGMMGDFKSYLVICLLVWSYGIMICSSYQLISEICRCLTKRYHSHATN